MEQPLSSAKPGIGVPTRTHQFYAVAFEENFSLRQIAPTFPEAKISTLELYLPIDDDGGLYIFPFGAVVTHDVPPERRDPEFARLSKILPKMTTKVIREDYSVVEDPGAEIGIFNGMLRVDKFNRARAGIVALTVAQSAAMEYYEQIVEGLFARTAQLVDQLQVRGSVPFRVRPMHRFIGEAISTRTEVLAVLHLLDKPDAAWEDPAMDRIYDDLRAEFDLVDRYAALTSKLQSIQEALVLVLDVARDRRLVLLEVVVVLLILLEVVLSLAHLA
jgi:required for meiotic nuclear division protein 1